ncbi:MAG: peptidoglycan-binding protein [Clostridia bacterium]|nr:peptidoglycan-binding protein [Clostridia bacterium]
MEERYSSGRDQSPNISELQEYLSYIADYIRDIPKIYPDGIYGPETQAAVRAFQTKYGLPQTGEADLATWTKIVSTFDDLKKLHKLPQKISAYPLEIPHLKEGDDFEEIYLLQIMLRRIAKIFRNITMPALTGVYDEMTKQAVQDFSRLYGKESSSTVDRELWNIITDTYNAFTHNH